MSRQLLSPQKVRDALEAAGRPLYMADLATQTGLPLRTLRFAIRRLIDLGEVQRRVDLTDTRRNLYSLVK